MAIDGGGGFVNVEQLARPPADHFLWSGASFNIAPGQGQELNVTGVVITAHFRGFLRDNLGQPRGQFDFFANNNGGGSSLTTTDAVGHFDLPVAADNWLLYPDVGAAAQGAMIFPDYAFTVSDGLDLTNNLFVQKPPARSTVRSATVAGRGSPASTSRSPRASDRTATRSTPILTPAGTTRSASSSGAGR